jgi:hypothetical protein
MSSHPVFSAGNLAVITGGASGIGLALATKCAGYDMNVIIADNNASNLKAAKESVKGKGKFETVEIDVSKLEEYEKVKSKVEKEFDGSFPLLILNVPSPDRKLKCQHKNQAKSPSSPSTPAQQPKALGATAPTSTTFSPVKIPSFSLSLP